MPFANKGCYDFTYSIVRTLKPCRQMEKIQHSKKMKPKGSRSVVVTFGLPVNSLPWWWTQIQIDRGLCQLSYERIVFRNKQSKQIRTFELPFLLIKMLFVLVRLRRQYDFIYTFECDLTTFAFSFWQTIFFLRRPRHVVLQFIMREKNRSLSSHLKYFFMKLVFSSIHKAICSASLEACYYQNAFNWPVEKLGFVPFHTSNHFLSLPAVNDEEYVVSAGRIFRDFETLMKAMQQANYRTIIIAPKDYVKRKTDQHNIDILEDIPSSKYEQLMQGSRVVVVALEDRNISAGQTVLLDAMALGKAIVATRTAATIDYIRHEENGLLVEAYNPSVLREAIDRLMRDAALRSRLGAAARQDVLTRYLPHHYTKQIRVAVSRQAEAKHDA